MDEIKRKFYLKYEIRRILLKSFKNNSNLPLTYRYFIFYQKIKSPR